MHFLQRDRGTLSSASLHPIKKQRNKPVKKTTIRIIAAVAAFVMVLCCTACGSETETKSEYTAEIVIKDFGTITVELYHDIAPITVEHFVKLAESGSYDGAYVTRMQQDFVLQAGDGAKDTSTIKGEFSANGVKNDLSHTKGVLSMARSSDNDSASSQFFIMLSDNYTSSLDGSYAAFGKVTDGWDVVEAIVASFTSDDFTADYYGSVMGFLKDSSRLTIETVRIK